MKSKFIQLVEQFLNETTTPALYAQQLRYALDGVKRGRTLVSMLMPYRKPYNSRVLDIGAGTGGISVAFAERGAEVYAVEPNDTHNLLMTIAVVQAAEYGVEIKPYPCKGEHLPFKSEYFDIVILNDVLEHARFPYHVLRQAVRVLKPDGIIYLSTPNKYSFKQILKEGHSQLFGVGLLPRWLAAWYVVKIRKRRKKYTVNKMLSYWKLTRYFKRLGVEYTMLDRNRPARHFRRWIPPLKQICTFLATRPSIYPGTFQFIVRKGEQDDD